MPKAPASKKASKAGTASATTASWLDSLASTHGTHISTTTKASRKASRATKKQAKADLLGRTVHVARDKGESKRKKRERLRREEEVEEKEREGGSRAPASHVPVEERGEMMAALSEVFGRAAEAVAAVPKWELPTVSDLLPPSARKKKAVKMSDESGCKILQPRPADYNGQGVARPSLYLDYMSPDFSPRFFSQFGEHVPGFFGKVKTGAMKKQRAREDREEGGGDGVSGIQDAMKGGAFEGLSANERVEKLLASGLL